MNFFTFLDSVVVFALVIAQLSDVYGETNNYGLIMAVHVHADHASYGIIELTAENGYLECLEKPDRPTPFLAFLDLAKEAMNRGWRVVSDDDVSCDLKAIP